MSSQRGNVKKIGAPKHQNKMVFKNNLHDTSKKTKMINSLDITGCCARCKDIIDWKIKYKKYKPLTVPKKCIKCGLKSVKRAYYIVCQECAKKERICAKCAQKNEIVQSPGLSPEEEAALHNQLEQELRLLPERQRRTAQRLQATGKCENEAAGGAAATAKDSPDSNDPDIEGESDFEEESNSGQDMAEDMTPDVGDSIPAGTDSSDLVTQDACNADDG